MGNFTDNFTTPYSGGNITNSTNSTATVPAKHEVMNHAILGVCVLIWIVGGLGNTLVIIVFGRQSSCRKSFEIYVVSLAVADLIGSIVLPGFHFHETLGRNFHHIGVVGCQTIFFFIIACNTVSALTLLVVSVDRYVMVKWPFRKKTGRKCIASLVALTWVLGFANGIIYFIWEGTVLSNKNGDGIMVCRFNFKHPDERKVFTLVTFIVQNVIPISSMVITYSLIACTIFKQSKSLGECELVVKMQFRRNRKLVKLLVVMVMVFFVCSLPISIFMLLYAFNIRHGDHIKFYRIWALLTMLHMVNSCANPIIYSKLHTKFRYGVRKLFGLRVSNSFRSVRSTLISISSRVRISLRREGHGKNGSIRLSPVDGNDHGTPNEYRRTSSGCEEKINFLATAAPKVRCDTQELRLSPSPHEETRFHGVMAESD